MGSPIFVILSFLSILTYLIFWIIIIYLVFVKKEKLLATIWFLTLVVYHSLYPLLMLLEYLPHLEILMTILWIIIFWTIIIYSVFYKKKALQPESKFERQIDEKTERNQSVNEHIKEKSRQPEPKTKELNEIENKKNDVETLCNLAIAYAEDNRREELLNTLNDLKFYTNKNINELLSAIQTVELMIRERVNIESDFLERLKVLLHRIKREHEILEP